VPAGHLGSSSDPLPRTQPAPLRYDLSGEALSSLGFSDVPRLQQKTWDKSDLLCVWVIRFVSVELARSEHPLSKRKSNQIFLKCFVFSPLRGVSLDSLVLPTTRALWSTFEARRPRQTGDERPSFLHLSGFTCCFEQAHVDLPPPVISLFLILFSSRPVFLIKRLIEECAEFSSRLLSFNSFSPPLVFVKL